MRIVILGSGVQGTLYGLRLARAGHHVTLVARGKRAAELRTQGAVIRNAITGRGDVMYLPVTETLAQDTRADLCFVFVRREQLERALSDLQAVPGIERVVFMVNHANGSNHLFTALHRERVVLGFPSIAGGIEGGVDVYVDVAEQSTTFERSAPDVAQIVQSAGFRIRLVTDMDSWLKRHAVFVTAVCGALYQKNGDAQLLSADKKLVRMFILALREGWCSLDRRGAAPAPLALRTIFCWVPLPLAVAYWCHLFGSARGEYYFARHARHAPTEMAALAADVRELIIEDPAPHLRCILDEITRRAEAGSQATGCEPLRRHSGR